MVRRKVLVLGAAGRDFHNHNMFFRHAKGYEVVGFTATQIPNIADRRYPASLAGPLYPEGIPIFEEKELESLIEEHGIEEVYFSYSDISHKSVMNLASRSQSKGASFILLGPRQTMLKSSKKVIAITAVRTGAGKSTVTRAIAKMLKEQGRRFVVIRHPMPYGDLERQKVQRFATMEDLDHHHCTIEEREEYEPHVSEGVVVYAGIDYGAVLEQAEKEADIILWDGGNNDMPFIEPDLHITLTDALRPGHEMWYYPGETNFRAADVIIINKSSENPVDIERIRRSIESVNPRAVVIEGDMELSASMEVNLFGRKVIVVEDGPTITHGEMRFGAGYEFAARAGAQIMDPRPFAKGSIKEAYSQHPHMGDVVPALGYYGEQIDDLTRTIDGSGAEYVVSGTPMKMARLLKAEVPVIDISYSFHSRKGSLEDEIGKALRD